MSRESWPPHPAPGSLNGHPSSEGRPREGPPPAGSFGPNPPSQNQQQSSSHSLMQQPGQYYPSSQQSGGHNLPTISGLTQPSPTQSGGRPMNQDGPPGLSQAQSQPGGPHGPGYQLPNINEAVQGQHPPPPNFDRERERERERHMQEEAIARERAQQRPEQEHHPHPPGAASYDQGPQHQNHAGSIPLHQPLAVAPQVRTAIHNGLLSNPPPPPPHGGPPPPQPLGAPSGPGNIFAGGPVQQVEGAPRAPLPQGGQQPIVPFPPGAGPAPAGQLAAGAPGQGQSQQPILNDALSYLDQVKVQFSEHPDVYNQFLDIMKDFKSGAIDTPGVIERVSNLFAGHPNLIQGFNTFLPPGYRIECGTGDDPNAIRVTTPMGTTVSQMRAAPRQMSPRSMPPGAHVPDPHPSGLMYSPTGRPIGPGGFVAQNQPSALEGALPTGEGSLQQQQERGVSQLQGAVSVATGGGPRAGLHMSPPNRAVTPLGQSINGGGAHQGAGIEKRGPVEFNHAISYVNKIKNRFQNQPDIYKQFLEILQTYQRESKPIQEVYQQVTTLFNAAPDLLEDFKQFLPESAAHAKAQAAARHAAEDAALLPAARDQAYAAAQAQAQQTPRPEQRLPPMGNFAPTPSGKGDNKRKRTDRQGTAGPSIPVMESSERRTLGPQSGKRQKQQHGAKPLGEAGAFVPPVSPTLTPALPEPLAPTTTTGATHDDLAFFERAKKHIGNKNTTNEFLKLCNLFSQDLIDKTMVVHRAEAFIGGNKELMDSFKKILNYDEQKDGQAVVVENKARAPPERVNLSNCRGLGPSYRLLPRRERMKQCSGRDELCHSVLNDEWASHPTWASEDSGFVVHRKNNYEEALHRIEEERHDYDFNIEICNRTIQLLEPIAQSLRGRSADERRHFTPLQPNLGSQSETIHKRAIMKLYGRERGRDVLEKLLAQPYDVVPILLNRLKQKLEEWKAAQREWEKVWREQTHKIFWRSLDNQHFSKRPEDKKVLQAKALNAELAAKVKEREIARQQRFSLSPAYDFAFQFGDSEVICDAAQLLLINAERNMDAEYPKVKVFIKEIVPIMFGLDVNVFQQRVESSLSGTPMEEEMEDGTPSLEDPSARRKPVSRKGDLLRGVLERGRSGRPSRRDPDDSVASTSTSRAATPELASGPDDDLTGAADTPAPEEGEGISSGEKWLDTPIKGMLNKKPLKPDATYQRENYNMYANFSIYYFIRTFMMLYERLVKLKAYEAEVHETVRRAQENKPAIDLKMNDKLPSQFFSDISPSANFYNQILSMFAQVLADSEILDRDTVEETLRRFYLPVGYHLYNFDRLVTAVCRYISNVVNSDKSDRSTEIIQLFRKDRAKEETSHNDEISYRRQVEKYSKDADIFRVTFIYPRSRMTITQVKHDEPTFDADGLTMESRWHYYIASWTAIAPTEGVNYALVRQPVLARNLKSLKSKVLELEEAAAAETTEDAATAATAAIKSENDADAKAAAEQAAALSELKSTENLEVLVSPEDYTIKYADGSSEWWYQALPPPSSTETGKKTEQETEEAKETQTNALKERYTMNCSWMRDLSQDEVNNATQEFRKLVEDGRDGDTGMAGT